MKCVFMRQNIDIRKEEKTKMDDIYFISYSIDVDRLMEFKSGIDVNVFMKEMNFDVKSMAIDVKRFDHII